MSYKRVLPRDLFNEAKLLKCYGQLSLLIHDGVGIDWPLELKFKEHGNGFEVAMDSSSGNIYCSNIHLVLFSGEKRVYYIPAALTFYDPYGKKGKYPMVFIRPDNSEDRLLDDEGKFTEEFKAYLNSFL